MTKKILFPTDLTPGSEPARELAVALTRKLGAELLVFHAVLTHADDLRQYGALLSNQFARLETEARKELEREASVLREQGLVVRYEVSQSSSAFDAILERATTWAPDLIAMATHGRTGMPRWFLGNVAEKVVRHAPCPVATFRPNGPARSFEKGFERIVVPIDFSENSRRAVAQACELAGDEDAIILHHVVHNPTLAGLASAEHLRLFSEEPSLPDKIREEMASWMGDRAFEACITEADDVAANILELADENKVDLIVQGARGQSVFDHFLTGSVAEKVVRSSSIPVITVK